MFICLNCGGPINSQQVAKDLYYLCSSYKNKGKAGCDKGVAVRKEEVETKIISAVKARFTPKRIKVIVREINSILNDDYKDLEQAEAHIEKSIQNIDNSIKNVLSAIQQGKDSAAIPLLIKQLEKLQQEKQSLENNLNELKKESPSMHKVDERTVLSQVQNLDTILSSSEASNKEKRMAIRYFIRQLQFNPDTGEVFIYYWQDPTGKDRERLKLINRKPSRNTMIKDGSGSRHQPGISMVSGLLTLKSFLFYTQNIFTVARHKQNNRKVCIKTYTCLLLETSFTVDNHCMRWYDICDWVFRRKRRSALCFIYKLSHLMYNIGGSQDEGNFIVPGCSGKPGSTP
ncbi:MAG: recombinase zinc beta ribbon domain-containing protein, partial [Firmicutes bacterium]|nr:recombinase zinc beta ribbon domain-containing protein [Bacillota bacterium]